MDYLIALLSLCCPLYVLGCTIGYGLQDITSKIYPPLFTPSLVLRQSFSEKGMWTYWYPSLLSCSESQQGLFCKQWYCPESQRSQQCVFIICVKQSSTHWLGVWVPEERDGHVRSQDSSAVGLDSEWDPNLRMGVGLQIRSQGTGFAKRMGQPWRVYEKAYD